MKKDSGRLGFFFTVMFLFNMAANFAHPVTPTIIVERGLNDYMFGMALAAMMVFNFLFSPFWGKMAGIFSSRKVMLLCGIGYGVGQVFFGLARTEMQFLLARMFAGIFVGGCYVAFLTYTVNASTEKKRGKNLAINAIVSSVSASFGYFVGGMVGEINPWYSVWLQSVVLAGASVLLFLGCREDKLQEATAVSPRDLWAQCNPFAALLQCRKLLTKALVFLFLAYGLGNLGYIAFEQCFNFYLRDQYLLSSGYNGIIKAALGVIALAANSTLCLWILKQKSVSPWLAGVMGACALATAAVIAVNAMVPFIVVNVVFFAFYFVSVPLMQNRAAVLSSGPQSNQVMGAFNAVKSFGSIFGSALAGGLYAFWPKLPFVFGLFAFALAAGMTILMWKAEQKNS